MEALMIFTACPEKMATEIARKLVHQKLAACVSILPGIQSIYRWHDAVEESKEVLLLIKTTKSCYDALEDAILNLHPYETPEILAAPITHATEACLLWLNESCTHLH